MKGLSKAFRAVLALSLVLCMVMSFVTVSAAATPVTLSDATVASKGADGLYEVKYTVSGFAAAEGDATILVYSGSSPDSATIAYPGQQPVAALEGGAIGYTFTMDLEGGSYTVIAGGTGMASATTTLNLDTAPAFASTEALTFDIKTDATEVGAIREAADYDNDEITYAVESEVFEVADGKIVVKAEAVLEAKTYNLTLTAAANGVASSNSVPVVINVTATTKYATEVAIAAKEADVAWGTDEAEAIASRPAAATVTIEGADAEEWEIAWGASEPAYKKEAAGAYVYTGTVTAPEGYELKDIDGKVTFTVNVANRVVENIVVPDIADIDWGKTPELPEYATLEFADGGSEDVKITWTNVDFVENTEGTFSYKATVDTGSYTYEGEKEFEKTFSVGAEPKKEISAIAPQADEVTVAWGEDPELPLVNVTVEGVTEAVEVNWAPVGEFSNEVAGEYTFTATYVYDEDKYILGAEVSAEVKVTVIVAKRLITAAKADVMKSMLPYGTSLEEALANLEIVTVTGTPGDIILEAEWALKAGEEYDGYDEGAMYTFVATLSTSDPNYEIAEDVTVEIPAEIMENPTIYITAIDTLEDVELAWGEEYEIPAEVGATFNKGEENKLAIAWENKEVFDNEKAGVYELKGNVVVNEGYELQGIDGVVTLKITVAQKTFVIETGSAELKAGDKYYIEGEAMGDAVVAAGDAVLTISGGEYCSGQTPVNEKELNNTTVWALGNAKVYITGGYFTAYGLPEGVNAGQVDMIYAKENAEIYISGGRFEAIGDRKDTVWLLNIKDDAVNAKIEITGGTFVGWNPATAVNADELTIPEGFTVKYDEAEDSYTVVPKSSITEIPTQKIYVLETDSYDDYVDILKETIEGVKVEGSKDITITNIIWPENEGEIENADFPAEPGKSVTVEAKSFDFTDEVLNTANIKPEVEFITVPATFSYSVDGVADKNSVVTLKDQAIAVEADYAGAYPELAELNAAVEYEYAVTSTWTQEPVWNALEAEIPAEVLDAVTGSSAKLWIRANVPAHCFTEALVAKVTVYREGDLFKGAVYFNPSEAENASDEAKYFSAFRVNKARDLNVVFDIAGSNGEYDFSAGTITVTATSKANDEVVLTKEVSGSVIENGRGKVVFEDTELAELNGAYSFKVAYAEGGEELFAVNRTTHIENKGLWFSKLSINKNTSAVGITINKNKPFEYVVNFDSTNADNKVYAGYDIVAYEGASADETGTLADDAVVEGTTWTESIDAKAFDKGSYKLYSYANLTDNQSFYDMAYGRTIYLFDGYSSLCNIYLEGSTNSAPVAADGDLDIAPHWGGRAPQGEDVMFECRLTLVNKNGDVIILTDADIEGGTVDAEGVITFPVDGTLTIKGAKAALNSSKVTATLELWAGADAESLAVDATKVKAFWTSKIVAK